MLDDVEIVMLDEDCTLADALKLAEERGWPQEDVRIEYSGCGSHRIDLVYCPPTVKGEVVKRPSTFTKFGPGTQHVKRQQEIAEMIRQDNEAMAEEATWD